MVDLRVVRLGLIGLEACTTLMLDKSDSAGVNPVADDVGIVFCLFFNSLEAVGPTTLAGFGVARIGRGGVAVTAGRTLLVVGLKTSLVGLVVCVRAVIVFLSLVRCALIVDLVSAVSSDVFCAVSLAEVVGVMDNLFAFVGRIGRLFSNWMAEIPLGKLSTELVECFGICLLPGVVVAVRFPVGRRAAELTICLAGGLL